VADELLGMPERSMQMDSQIFPPKNDTQISVSDVPQVQELYLTNLVELRSWRFFGDSIDSFKYSCNFQ
jgi:hypothetical protein